jgi:serine/threonine protein kinase
VYWCGLSPHQYTLTTPSFISRSGCVTVCPCEPCILMNTQNVGDLMQELESHCLGHYHIKRGLARGGMSAIYLAQDTQNERMVAIKLVHSDNDYYERFRHEVIVTAALSHDHILPVLDSGEEKSWYYMVTPYMLCGTLHERLQQGPLSLQQTDMVLEQLALALQYAHDCGVLHRDIKPSNVLLGDEEGQHIYLADFGLGKRIDDEKSLTLTDYLIGTPEYMAPELADQPATTSSDIYALGILTYQMLTGSVPFHGSMPIGTYLKHIREEPAPPSQLNPAISRSIDQVILKVLDKRPEKRFRSAQEFAEAYRQALEPEESRVAVLAQRATLALFSTVSIKIRRQRKHVHRTLATGLAAVMLIGALSFGLTLSHNVQRPVEPVILSGIGAQIRFPDLSYIPAGLLAALSTQGQPTNNAPNKESGTTPQPGTTATPTVAHHSNHTGGSSITRWNRHGSRDSHHKKRKNDD